MWDHIGPSSITSLPGTATMDLSIWLLALIALAVCVQFLPLLIRHGEPAAPGYALKSALLTPAERSFYGVLRGVVDESTIIFTKVRVADILTPDRGLQKGPRQSAFNKISSKHFDFILCRSSDLSALCAIELNDRSHNSSKRQRRDEFLEKACGSAGLPLLQITAKRGYSKEELLRQLESALVANRNEYKK